MASPTQDAQGLAPQSLVQVEAQRRPSAFDAIRAPEVSVMDKCVHCGFCLPACPTYVLWGEEMDSPRGRIWMMRKGSQGEAVLDQNFRQHMDNCLGCMACMTACPSGVEYNKLIEDTRAQVERHIPRPRGDSIFRRMLFATFPYPRRLRLLGVPMAIYQGSGLQRLTRAMGLLKLLPRRLQAMESLLPPVPLNPFHPLPAHVNAHAGSAQRGRVGMLTGCVQDAFFAHVNAATARVLAAEGFEVIIPQQQGCCGALMVHSGLDEQAMTFAKRLIVQFEEAGVDSIVINAAGCGSTMKDYGHLFRGDEEWAPRAAVFSGKCRDISEVLEQAGSNKVRSPLPLRVAYHDACHLRHAQGVHDQPRTLLAEIPGLEVAEIAEATLCCGSAGVYNLLHPETADELGDRKVQNLLATRAEAVVSANPGCLLQLMAGLRRIGHEEMPTFHMIELLDASIRGVTREQLLHGKRSLRIHPQKNRNLRRAMTGDREKDLLAAADLLMNARRTGQRLNDLPENLRPLDMTESEFIQDAMAAAYGDIGGYKIGAGTPDAKPTFAPMPAAWFAPSGAILSGDKWRYRVVEGEIAFLLSEDLPPRAAPYSREEVLAATASCHPIIEVLETAFNDPDSLPAPTVLADLQRNGGFIYGPAFADWRATDFTQEKVTLTIDGSVRVERTGSNTSGDFFRLLVWMANEAAPRTGGLRAGQWITTGSWTGNTVAGERSTVDVLFSRAGRVELRFA